MCIISGDPVYVAKTKIFVAPVVTESKEPRQLTVYCNNVGLKKDSGTMILPFPESEVEFYNLESYVELFEDLSDVWPKYRGYSDGAMSLGVSRVQVGSYTASTVSLEELANLNEEDKSFYLVDGATLKFVRDNYPKGYKFVLCKLDKQKDYHPFGFIHGSLPGALFVPTMHYHHHETDPRGSNFVRQPKRQHDPDWDHVIYFWNAALKDTNFARSKTKTEQMPPSLQLDKLPALPPFKCLTAIKVNNYSGNHDLAAELI